MGALGSKAYSGAGIIAALLFILSGVLVFADGGDLTTDTNSIALCLIAISGVLAIIYSVSMLVNGSTFVRKTCGAVLLISGLVFLISPLLGDAATLVAVAALLSAVAALLDVFAIWVSSVKNAYMCLSAFFGVVGLILSVWLIINGYDVTGTAVVLIIIGVWILVSACVVGFGKAESAVKTREVVETPVAPKKEQEHAKNTKATPKAKKPEQKKEEPKKEEPVEEPKKPEQKKEEPKKEEPVEEPKKPEQKKEEVAPAKATGDFMKKLMKSSDAANAQARREAATEVAPAEPVVSEPVQAPAEEPVESVEEPVEGSTEEVPVESVEEPVEEVLETPAEEPVEESTEEMPVESVEEPADSVISEPVQAPAEESEFKAAEPDWGVVVRDSASEGENVETPRAPAETPVEEAPVESVSSPEPVEEAVEEAPVEEPAEAAVSLEESAEIPVETPVEEAPVESVISEPVQAPAEESEFKAAEPDWGAAAAQVSVGDSEEEELGEDIYTDNSPEALVRRAAWNKGLRCRRGYGERNIPVAFVKGKVAVYVENEGADTSGDDDLRAEGWTVLRYNAADITDGKAQGDEIAAAVKANTRSTKRKSRK